MMHVYLGQWVRLKPWLYKGQHHITLSFKGYVAAEKVDLLSEGKLFQVIELFQR